jgi:hypothetical protein
MKRDPAAAVALLRFRDMYFAVPAAGPASRGFRNRRDAHAAAGPELGSLVVLTARWRSLAVELQMPAAT